MRHICALSVIVMATCSLFVSADDPEFIQREEFSCADIAKAINHYVSLGEQNAVKEIVNVKGDKSDLLNITGMRLCFLCRILFQPKGNQPLRLPALGGLPSAFQDAPPKQWPLFPMAKSGNTFFVLSEDYAFGGGRQESHQNYVEYCQNEGTFLTKPVVVPTKKEAMAALDQLRGSDRWKKINWIGVTEESAISFLQAQVERIGSSDKKSP